VPPLRAAGQKRELANVDVVRRPYALGMEQNLGQMIVAAFWNGTASTARAAWEWAVANPLPAVGIAALVIISLLVPARPRRRRRA